MKTRIVGQQGVSANFGIPLNFTGSAANSDRKSTREKFGDIADVYGFSGFALLDINRRNQHGIHPQVMDENLNPDLMDMINASGDLGACTLFDRLEETNVPFGWQIGYNALTGELSAAGSLDAQFDSLLEAFEIRGGYCVPVYSVTAQRYVVIYFTHRREGMRRYAELVLETIELFDELVADGEITLEEPRCALNRCELDCLAWSAQGKSVPEVAQLLSLSEHSIRLYFKAVVTKLNTNTVAEAVYKATHLGLLPK